MKQTSSSAACSSPTPRSVEHVGKVICVLLDALIGIDADRSRAGDEKGAPWRQPLRDQVAGQPLAQSQLHRQAQPLLGDVEGEQRAGDEHIEEKLPAKAGDVLLGERIVKGPRPDVQADLHGGGGADHGEQPGSQAQQGGALRRGAEGAQKEARQRDEAVVLRRQVSRDIRRGVSLFRHRSPTASLDLVRRLLLQNPAPLITSSAGESGKRAGRDSAMNAKGIEKLLAGMTLAEKLGQMTMSPAGSAPTGPVRGEATTEAIRAGKVGALLNIWGRETTGRFQKLAMEETRLGIPLLFGVDVLHGHKTVFPIPLAEASLFDPRLWERTARAAAREAAADGADLTFAPMLDTARDPRWGRIAEGFGEDPLVGARFAAAKVRGFQGGDLGAPGSLAATAKHFCCGGAALAGREYAAADMSERALHEIYLPPFRAAVQAGCAAIMSAFNSVAGVPMTAHVPLLRGYLREKLGFDGVIMSDYAAIEELIDHGVAADRAQAAALALKAGVDIDMVSGVYLDAMPEALARGLAEMKDIDAAVRRILALKMKLGLFDDPYRRVKAARSSSPATKKLAHEVARRAVTLLTNDEILPLGETVRRIAVIGPLAEARAEMLGPWTLAGDPRQCSTIVEGLRAVLPDREIQCAPGVAIVGDDDSGIAAARALCDDADVVILCLGEAAAMSGEAASRARPELPGRQRQLAEAVLASGRPVVVLLSSGRPLIVPFLAERARALVATWFLGAGAGQAIAEVLTGRFDPTGRLPVTWPLDVGQIPIFFAERPAARPANPTDPFTSKYIDLPNEPQFPFGHGLSYAQVKLDNLRLGQAEFRPGDRIRVEIDAENLSDRPARETIFLFSRDRVAAAAPPVLELKDWAKVELAPRQKSAVVFNLAADDLSCLDADLQPRLEPGDFDVFVGLSADRRFLLSARLRCLA